MSGYKGHTREPAKNPFRDKKIIQLRRFGEPIQMIAVTDNIGISVIPTRQVNN